MTLCDLGTFRTKPFNCNCLFNSLGDITKLFCCCFNASEGKSKLFIFSPNWLADELACLRIGSLTNWLADEFVPTNCLASELETN